MIALLLCYLGDLQQSRDMVGVELEHHDHALWIHRFYARDKLPLYVLIGWIVDKSILFSSILLNPFYFHSQSTTGGFRPLFLAVHEYVSAERQTGKTLAFGNWAVSCSQGSTKVNLLWASTTPSSWRRSILFPSNVSKESLHLI